MRPRLMMLLLISSSLQFFLDFSHILLLSLVGFSVSALSGNPSLLTVGICLGGVALAVVALQTARFAAAMKSLRKQRLRKRLLRTYSAAQADMHFALAYFLVLVAGSIVLLALIGAWEALVVTFLANGLAWLLAKLFVHRTIRPTKDETKSTRRRLRPLRNMTIDAIPLVVFILGLALFPNLLGLQAIPLFLILRHTCRHVFQMTLQSGLHNALQTTGQV